MHQDQALDRCTAKLFQVLFSKRSCSNVETLSLTAIAIKSAEAHLNPFKKSALLELPHRRILIGDETQGSVIEVSQIGSGGLKGTAEVCVTR